MLGQRSTAEVPPLARKPGARATEERPLLLTATVDASHQAAAGVTGIGIVLQATNRRRRRGPILAEISEAYEGVPASVTELLAVFRALEIARERGYPRVKVRSDYNYLRRQLKDAHAVGWIRDPRSLHGQTLALAQTFENVQFAYQPRRKNAIAHNLARKATRDCEPARRPELFQAEPRKAGRRAKRSARRALRARDFVAPYEPDFLATHEPNFFAPYEPDFLATHELDFLATHEPDFLAPREPDLFAPHEPDLFAPHEPDFLAPREPDLFAPHELDFMPHGPEFLMPHELGFFAPHEPLDSAPTRPSWTEDAPQSDEWRQEFQNRYGECWIASATRSRFLLTGDDIAWRTIRVDAPAYEQLAAELQRKTGPAPAFEGVTLNREEQMWLIAVLLAAPRG